MIAYFLQSGIILLLFLAVYHFLLRKEPFFAANRAALWLAMMASLILPLLSDWLIPAQQLAIAGIVNLEEMNVWIAQTQPGLPVHDSTGNSVNIFILLYAAIAIAFFFRLLYGLNQLSNIKKEAEIRVINGQTVYFSTNIETPFSFFNKIFMPFEHNFNREALRLILKHEKAHGIFYHSVDNIIIGILKSVLWCIPPIYWFEYLLKEIHEFQADNTVINQEPEKRQIYGMLLIGAPVALPEFNAIPGNYFFSSLKNRINMITNVKTNPFAQLKFLLFIPAFYLSILCLTIFQKQDAIGMDLLTIDANSVQDSVYKSVDIMPLFPGCYEEGKNINKMDECSKNKLFEFVSKNIKYPSVAKEAKAEGTVVVRFIVETDGMLSGVKVVRSVHESLDNEARKLVESMNNLNERWTPGKDNNGPVRVEMHLPVSYKLNS